MAAPTPGTPHRASPTFPRTWIPFFIPGDLRAQISQPEPRDSGMPLPALRVPSRTLESQAYCRLVPPPGSRSLNFPVQPWIPPLDLDPPPRPRPGSSRHRPRLCQTPPARAGRPPRRVRIVPRWCTPSAHLRSSGLNSRPSPSVQAGLAAALDTGPLWSCPWSPFSAASPPPSLGAAAAGGGGAGSARIPPAAPLTRGYPGPPRPGRRGLRVLLAKISAPSSAPQLSETPTAS